MNTLFLLEIKLSSIFINNKYIYLQEEYLGFVARLILHVRELSNTYFNLHKSTLYNIYNMIK